MQIAKECEPYLNSEEVIRIIQSGNETFKSRILNCIQKHKVLVCRNVFTSHQLLAKELLTLCSENAFQDTQITFLSKVETGKFSPEYETCIPFLKGIFRKKYWYEYQQELKRKMVIAKMENYAGTIAYVDCDNELQEKVNTTIKSLNTEDQNIYELRYKQGLKATEIAAVTSLQPQTVRDKICKLHRRFAFIWK